jgi:hypothetical protein
MKKYKCKACDYYWEVKASEHLPIACPICKGTAIHRSSSHKRFSKRARQKIRRSFSLR